MGLTERFQAVCPHIRFGAQAVDQEQRFALAMIVVLDGLAEHLSRMQDRKFGQRKMRRIRNHQVPPQTLPASRIDRAA